MKKLTMDAELSGKVIRGIYPSQYGYELVLVFDDDDWAVFFIQDNGTDDAAVGLEQKHHGAASDIKNYLSPDDLLEAQLLTQAQHDYLVNENKKTKAEKLRKHAEQLLLEASKLSEAA